MKKASDNRNRETFSLDRREFIAAGLVLAAAATLPNIAFGAPAARPMMSSRRKLGAL